MHDVFESVSWWLGGISKHTFTMYESKSPLEDELLEAYYLRLRDMMADAVRPWENDATVGREARAVLEALDEIDVRSTV
jgi:hypothetical protein